MKKYLSTIALTLLIIPCISLASIDLNLKYGSNGTEVKELQEFLIDKGFLSGQSTGSFFTLTRKAVIAYQASVGLPNTGYVGPMTREKINNELLQADTSSNQAEVIETGTTTPPTKSSAVTYMQEQINALLAQLQLLNAQVKTQTTVQQQIQTTLQQTQQNTQQIQQNTTPVTSPTPTPTTTSSPVPPPTPSPTPTPVDKSAIIAEVLPILSPIIVDGQLSGRYGIRVSLLDKNGTYIRNPILMTSSDGYSDERTPNSQTTSNSADWSASFSYAPKSIGQKDLTFTSGSVTKSISLDVNPGPQVDIKIENVVNENLPIAFGYSGATIGSFNLTQANEPTLIQSIQATDSGGNQVFVYCGVSVCNNTSTKNTSQTIQVKTDALTKGTYTITVNKIIIDGVYSGLTRVVNGLPIIFTYKVE